MDTAVSFEVISHAANGLYSDAYGAMNVFTKNGRSFTLKPGNWSNPATWSTDEVPANITEVYILHPVNVEFNAECKTFTAELPGNITVNTGQSLKVFK